MLGWRGRADVGPGEYGEKVGEGVQSAFGAVSKPQKGASPGVRNHQTLTNRPKQECTGTRLLDLSDKMAPHVWNNLEFD